MTEKEPSVSEMIEKAFTFGPIRLPMPRVNPPAQMSKWFNTTYGFVMGIAAAALSIAVVSAVAVGIALASMALIVYGSSLYQADRCMRLKQIELSTESDPQPGLSLEQVNECRKKNSLSTFSLQDVKEKKPYKSYLGWMW